MSMTKSINGRGRGGFTLIEAILAIVIISALVVGMGYLLDLAIDSYGVVVDRREALQKARLAANMIENDLATIQNPATDISAIATDSISFTDDGGSAVTYSVSGGNLLRNGEVLASGVSGGTGFSYYTSGGGTTSDPTQVYRVGFTIAVPSESSSHGTVQIEDQVYLRNRYYDSFTKQ